MKVIIDFDHAVNRFEIEEFIDQYKDNPAIHNIYIEESCRNNCNECDSLRLQHDIK